MAKKGQTCSTCDATCCRLSISYEWPKDSFKGEETFITKTGRKTRWKFLDHTQAELKAYGFKDFAPQLKYRIPCHLMTAEGLCSRHKNHKPKLCRSFYCGGRLWSPKGTRLNLGSDAMWINDLKWTADLTWVTSKKIPDIV